MPRSLLATGSASHVEAFRCTGSSPGRSGSVSVSFPAEYGGLVDTRVPFEVHGPAHARPIVVLGGISAGRHLLPTSGDPSPGWWDGVVAERGALDPLRHRLVGIDFVGGSTAATDPTDSTGSAVHVDPSGPVGPARAGSGPVSTFDQARALARVLDALDLYDVTLVGASYGGMVALAFAALAPSRTRQVIAICAAHRTHPLATAVRSVQRRAVRLARRHGSELDGLALARSLAMTTYRSAAEFDARFPRDPLLADGTVTFPVDRYLDARGADFAGRWSADRFLALSESIDLHDLVPTRIRSPLSLLSFDTDTLVPPWLVDELAAATSADHTTLTSVFGHDAFLKEVGCVSEFVREALDGEVVR